MATQKKRDWIGSAIKHPGALHAQLGVPQGEKIPGAKLQKAVEGADGPLAKKRALLARTMAGFSRG